jgi:hypothetical protein
MQAYSVMCKRHLQTHRKKHIVPTAPPGRTDNALTFSIIPRKMQLTVGLYTECSTTVNEESVRGWFKHYATSRKVVGSIPERENWISHLI